MTKKIKELLGKGEKHYYALYVPFANCKELHIFKSKEERDNWVKEDTDINPNRDRMHITASQAQEYLKKDKGTIHKNGIAKYCIYDYDHKRWIGNEH